MLEIISRWTIAREIDPPGNPVTWAMAEPQLGGSYFSFDLTGNPQMAT